MAVVSSVVVTHVTPKNGWWLSHEDSEFSGDVGAVMVRARDVEMTSPCLDDVPIKP